MITVSGNFAICRKINMINKQELSKQVPGKIDVIVDILKKFRFALKSLRFYPPGHTIIKNSVAALLDVLSDYLSVNHKLCLTVKKKGLSLKDKSAAVLGFKDIASYLSNFKVRQITFTTGLAADELIDLLAILCMERQEILANGGFNEMLIKKYITHFQVVELTLGIVSIDKSQTNKVLMPKINKNKELIRIIKAGTDISKEDSEVLLVRLEDNSEDLAELLIDIIKNNPDESISKSESLYAALKKMDLVIAQELPDKQSYLYQKLWEALQRLPDNISEKLYSLIIDKQDSDNDIFRELFSRLSIDKLVEVITKAVSENAGSSAMFKALMDKLPVDRDKYENIYKNLKNKLPANIVNGAKLNYFDNKKNVYYQKMRKELSDEQLTDITAFCCESINKHEVDSQISEYRHHSSKDDVIGILLDGLTDISDLGRFKSILNKLSSIILESVKEKNYQRATEIMNLVKEEANNLSDITFKLEVKRAVNNICGRELISSLIEVCAQDKAILSEKNLLNFLKAIGAQATDMLLDRLAVEENAARRMAICRLISDINTDNISYLAQKLNDQRWYLVRNIIHILGIIKNENAIKYMDNVINHPEKRVRLEVIDALTNIGGCSSAVLLGKLVGDKEIEVSNSAIKALGLVGDKDTLKGLMPLLKKRDILYRRTMTNLRIIESLGEAGIVEAISVLIQIKKRRSRIFKKKSKQLQLAAVKSLSRINQIKEKQ